MKAQDLLNKIEQLGVQVITGVPDSTLKQFCDGVQTYQGNLKHYVPANEGAAVGIAVGTYLATGKPACVYLQNSGIGNIVNPLVSIANEKVYGIPMLFIAGWRGEPGTKDEPQHAFQGEITCALFDTLQVPYSILDKNTSKEQLDVVWKEVSAALEQKKQYALIVQKGTFEADQEFVWENGHPLNREYVLRKLLEFIPKDTGIVSTTGKISRELYEQSDRIRGNHDALFMTVGGMGHASMIAFGLAQSDREKKIVCVDGDGAALMHMGALPFIAANAGKNYIHVVINNQAHESVGAMPTGCQNVSLAKMAEAAGYSYTEQVRTMQELEALKDRIMQQEGPALYEIMVSLDSRADLGRPKESARENRDAFMGFWGSV